MYKERKPMPHKLPHRHPEAFCLMRYECQNPACKHQEVIWNSRDGMTPFGVDCSRCVGGIMLHTAWRLDRRAYGHKLRNGDRYFRDYTPDDAERTVRMQVERSRAAGHKIDDELVERWTRSARFRAMEDLKTGRAEPFVAVFRPWWWKLAYQLGLIEPSEAGPQRAS